MEWRKVFDSVFKQGTPVAKDLEDASETWKTMADAIRSVRILHSYNNWLTKLHSTPRELAMHVLRMP